MKPRSISLNGHKLLSNGDRRPRAAAPARRHVNGNHGVAPIVVPARAVTSPIAKFVVGFTAGSSLVFLPPLLTSLAFREAEPSDVVLFTTTRISLGVVVAVFIAIITTIQEYQKPARPWSIFTRALALPGLVIGSWQTLADNAKLRDADKELHAAEDLAAEVSGIPEIPAKTRAAEPTVRLKISGLTRDNNGVQAASLLPPDLLLAASSQFGASVEEPRFVIVIDRRPDSTSAATRAQELRSTCCPRASYLREQPSGGWYVVESSESRTRTEALRKAIEIRKIYPKLELDPQLLAVEK